MNPPNIAGGPLGGEKDGGVSSAPDPFPLDTGNLSPLPVPSPGPAAVGHWPVPVFDPHVSDPERRLVIYGVSLLAGCMIGGLFLGEILGQLIGVQANVGGVGIAMLGMILLSDRLRRAGRLSPVTEQGVLFWSSIYIPVVVAMAASQNVVSAVRGGPAAILAGAGAVVVCFALVPVLSRMEAREAGSGPDAGEAP